MSFLQGHSVPWVQNRESGWLGLSRLGALLGRGGVCVFVCAVDGERVEGVEVCDGEWL